MSVASVAQRAVAQPVRPQREREPAKSVDKQHQAKALPPDRPAAKPKATAHHADVTYSRAKEPPPQHLQPKGTRVDLKA